MKRNLIYLLILPWFIHPSNGQPAPPLSERVAFVTADPNGACIQWPNANSVPLEYNMLSNTLWGCSNNVWTAIGVGGGGGGGTGTANTIVKFLTATTIGNSSVQDDGVTVRNSENMSLGTNALLTAYPNSTSGTVPFTLTKLDNSSKAIKILTSDTANVYGVCAVGCAAAASSTTALIAIGGQIQCVFDNQTIIRDFVVASTSVAGDCSDAGGNEPTGVQVIGRVVNLNSGTGTTATIEIFSPDTTSAIPPVKKFTVANANPGTVLNETVKITGAPSTGTIAAITDTGGVIGICSGGCGNSGTATILQAGAASCVFDGATTAGDYVQISATNAGQCHDAGANYPVPGQVIGRVTSTNGGSGTYGILVFPPESSNPASASIAAGTINDIVKYTAANAIGPSGCTIDSSNNEVCPGSVTTGSAAAFSGELVMSGHTSGSQGIGVLDAAGATPILYLLPTTPSSTSQFMQDGGSVTCPTLAPGSPTTCHQLQWATTAAAGAAGGDLSGTYPNPTVAQVNGGVVPTSAHVVGTNSSKQIIAATGHDVAAILTCATSSASGTAETCNTSPTFTPAAGDSIIFQADVANTGAFTLNVNSQGAKSVKKNGTTALVANDILATPFQVLLTYDGTSWEMQGQSGNASSGGGLTCTKYTITQSPFGTTWTVTGQSGQAVTASVTTQTINIVTLASKAVINALRIKHTTAFAGTSITDYTMSLGSSAQTTTWFSPAFDVFNATSHSPAGTTPGYYDDGGSFSGADNGETVTATFTSTGGNLTATTAGSVDVTLCTTTLP